MSKLKRATKILHDAGLTTLEVHHGLWGYSVRDTRFTRQSTVVHKDCAGAVEAALAGQRPEPSTSIREDVWTT